MCAHDAQYVVRIVCTVQRMDFCRIVGLRLFQQV
jgi:hypothetical protein